MTKDEFISEIATLGISYTQDMLEKLAIYKEFLKAYNMHTNLTSIKDDESIYLKHFYDSLTIVKAISLEKAHTLIDLGTGAGFPGMVIKIFFPHLAVTLLDSNHKKTEFLNKLKNLLHLEVAIINDRCENYAQDNLNKFDIVISRALANMRVLSELALPLVKVKGYFIAMKGNMDNESQDYQKTITILDSKIVNIKEFDLYHHAGIRTLIVVQKLKETKKETLRSYAKIIKKPLEKRD